jgi:hypothetical protein
MFKLIALLIAVLVIGVGAVLIYRNNQKKIETDATTVEDVAKKL